MCNRFYVTIMTLLLICELPFNCTQYVEENLNYNLMDGGRVNVTLKTRQGNVPDSMLIKYGQNKIKLDGGESIEEQKKNVMKKRRLKINSPQNARNNVRKQDNNKDILKASTEPQDLKSLNTSRDACKRNKYERKRTKLPSLVNVKFKKIQVIDPFIESIAKAGFINLQGLAIWRHVNEELNKMKPDNERNKEMLTVIVNSVIGLVKAIVDYLYPGRKNDGHMFRNSKSSLHPTYRNQPDPGKSEKVIRPVRQGVLNLQGYPALSGYQAQQAGFSSQGNPPQQGYVTQQRNLPTAGYNLQQGIPSQGNPLLSGYVTQQGNPSQQGYVAQPRNFPQTGYTPQQGFQTQRNPQQPGYSRQQGNPPQSGYARQQGNPPQPGYATQLGNSQQRGYATQQRRRAQLVYPEQQGFLMQQSFPVQPVYPIQPVLPPPVVPLPPRFPVRPIIPVNPVVPVVPVQPPRLVLPPRPVPVQPVYKVRPPDTNLNVRQDQSGNVMIG